MPKIGTIRIEITQSRYTEPGKVGVNIRTSIGLTEGLHTIPELRTRLSDLCDSLEERLKEAGNKKIMERDKK